MRSCAGDVSVRHPVQQEQLRGGPRRPHESGGPPAGPDPRVQPPPEHERPGPADGAADDAASGDQEQRRRVLLRLSDPDPGVVRRRRHVGQESVSDHLARHTVRQRGPVHDKRHQRERGFGVGEDDPQQYFHDSETQRRRTGHAVPVVEADQQHLGVAGVEVATGGQPRHVESQVEVGRGGSVRFSSVRCVHQECLTQLDCNVVSTVEVMSFQFLCYFIRR
jgi:hypothetical protein